MYCIVELEQVKMCTDNTACLNGGQCVEDIPNNSYKCNCPPSSTGEHCEISE